jgi:signal transduction histidine kinase/phage shock protein PspC (stress-responsive transcriptional regulator)
LLRVIRHGARTRNHVTIDMMGDMMSESAARPVAGGPALPTAAGAAVATPPNRVAPRATRRVEGRLIGGVASGVADHLGLRVLHVRIAFVVLAWFGGFGAVAYAVLWFLLPQAEPPAEAPGLASATRQGKRPQSRSRAVDIGQIVALAVLGIGVVGLVQFAGLGVSSRLFWPIVFAGVGVALIWRQADDAQRSRWVQASPRVPVVGSLIGTGGWASAARFVLGLALVGGSVAAFVLQRDSRAIYDDVLLGVLLALAGVALIFGPLVYRLTTDLSSERRERIRSQERADMAAHLHDSVLQTLALIQKQSTDPRRVASLARSQERELRDWLYADATPASETLRSALRKASGDIEDAHGVAVEVVTVGDAPLDDRLAALLRAAREAMVNAAKHAQVDRLDVYAEVDADQVALFVRDRGVGFDPETIPADRLGVRGSIQDRMRRHGGTAIVRSVPGEGTEVRLVMKRSTGPAAPATEENVTP